MLLEGQLASAILRARVAAHEIGAKPLAVVCAPSLSEAALAELGEFVARYGEGIAWGAVDASGLAVFHGAGLESVRRPRRRAPKPPVARPSEFLADLGQWMLKVLVSHRLPPALQVKSPLDHRPIDAPVANAAALARIAAVSVPTAARFVASLRQEQYFADDEVLRVVRVEELLALLHATSLRHRPDVRTRWLFPPHDAQKHLDETLRKYVQKPGQRACIGLFAACDRLGYRFVRGVAPHVYLEKVTMAALHQLGLRVAESGEAADVIVREPRFREALFRGELERDGVPVTDVLQCWLDVKAHPARGEEMAEHLLENVIRPSLLDGEH